MTEAARLNRIRGELQAQSEQGMLGVVAGYSHVAEWIVRDWCDKPENIPTQDEVAAIELALTRIEHARILTAADHQTPLF